MDDRTPLQTPDQIRARLDDLRAARGYLLPHHGAMAASAPDLHDAYLTLYRALALTDRHLNAFEKEFIWLAVLSAMREPAGTHHAAQFHEAGGTAAQAALAFRLAGYGAAADTFAFVGAQWDGWFPQAEAQSGYLAGADALAGGAIDPGLANLALLAVQAARRCAWGVRAHLVACYAAGVPEDKIAEALSLLMWPVGVNRFVDACAIWRELMVCGDVVPSSRYLTWANTPGQGPLTPRSAGDPE